MPDNNGTQIVKKIINATRQIITNGKKPEGNCTTWNQDLSIALRMNNISSIPYGSPSYELTTRDGGITVGHCITIANTSDVWLAIDLSSQQVKDLSPEKIWRASSFEDLCTTVNQDLHGFMKFKPGDESEMLRAAQHSKAKDLREGRYVKFNQDSSTGERKG